MPTYKFAESAEADLDEIINYTLQTWGQQQALTYIDGLEALAASLAELPKTGKKCDELASGLLVFPYREHLIYYFEQPHGITIARVLHRRMGASRHFDDIQ